MTDGSESTTQSRPPADRALNFTPGSYLEVTARPLYGLVFLLPLFIFYEVGTVVFLTDPTAHTQTRIVAYAWLMRVGEWLGLHPHIAWASPGFMAMLILLCWQLVSKQSWRVRLGHVPWMYVECLVLTAPLFAIGSLINGSLGMSGQGTMAAMTETAGAAGWLSDWVTSIGAGIYEELVFRLILINLLLLLLEDLLRVKKTLAMLIAVAVSAVLFAGHHYVAISQGGELVSLAHEPFGWYSFLFRTAAGVYFAAIFHYRGYGITAGTHAAYNIIYFSFT